MTQMTTLSTSTFLILAFQWRRAISFPVYHKVPYTLSKLNLSYGRHSEQRARPSRLLGLHHSARKCNLVRLGRECTVSQTFAGGWIRTAGNCQEVLDTTGHA